MTNQEIDQVNLGFDNLYQEEGIEIDSSDKISFVASKDNTLIGCASGLIYKNGKQYSGWFFLTDLFVEKQYRSKGLGAKLLSVMEGHLLTLNVKHIWLWTSGHKSLKFYKRHGYLKFAEMESWYSDGSSRVGLRKSLTKS